VKSLFIIVIKISEFPVNWFDLPNQIEQIINQLQYLDRYEYKETRKLTDNPYYGRHQINNFLKAIDAFGRATGSPGLRKMEIFLFVE